MVTISPVQDSTLGSPQVISCTVSTVNGVELNLVMISWMGPGGGSIANNSRVTISPTTSSGNTYTSSLQFAYLIEEDEGIYVCDVTILKASGLDLIEIRNFSGTYVSVLVQNYRSYFYLFILSKLSVI